MRKAPWVLMFALSLAAADVVAAESVSAPTGSAPSGGTDPRRLPDTIMFTIDELTEIQSRIATLSESGEGGGAQRQDNSSEIERSSLYLSTILYSSPQEWMVWINGVPITPRHELQAFRVTDIGPDFVELVVPLSAQGMRPVRLAPNQSFITRSGSVVEGPWTQ